MLSAQRCLQNIPIDRNFGPTPTPPTAPLSGIFIRAKLSAFSSAILFLGSFEGWAVAVAVALSPWSHLFAADDKQQTQFSLFKEDRSSVFADSDSRKSVNWDFRNDMRVPSCFVLVALWLWYYDFCCWRLKAGEERPLTPDIRVKPISLDISEAWANERLSLSPSWVQASLPKPPTRKQFPFLCGAAPSQCRSETLHTNMKL